LKYALSGGAWSAPARGRSSQHLGKDRADEQHRALKEDMFEELGPVDGVVDGDYPRPGGYRVPAPSIVDGDLVESGREPAGPCIDLDVGNPPAGIERVAAHSDVGRVEALTGPEVPPEGDRPVVQRDSWDPGLVQVGRDPKYSLPQEPVVGLHDQPDRAPRSLGRQGRAQENNEQQRCEDNFQFESPSSPALYVQGDETRVVYLKIREKSTLLTR